MFNAARFAAYLVPVLGICLISLLIFVANHKSKQNRYFILLNITVAVWLVLLYFADVTKSYSLAIIFVRLAVAESKFIGAAFLLFCASFPNPTVFSKKHLFIIIAPMLLFSGIGLSPLMIQKITLESTGASIASVSWLYTVDTVVLVAYFILGGGILQHQKKRSTRVQKSQINFILAGILIALSINLFTNYLYTLITGKESINIYGGLSLLTFVSFTAYAIFKHQLFDIRVAAARALTYVLSLGTIAGGYGLIVFGLLVQLFGDNASRAVQRAVFIGLAVFSSLFYSRIKKFFDKLTTGIFFQDAYEPQIFLDELNEVLVVNIELEKLLTETVRVIENNLKANFCVFSLRETSYFPRRIIGDTSKRFEHGDIEEMGSQSMHIHEKVIVADVLEENNKTLKNTLDKNEVAILVRLVSTLEYEVEGIGYVMFGYKKSGNPYNKADQRILDIIANELVIAVQNGLRFEEIEKFNATLEEKIDDATRKLQKSNEKLKTLDETKDEFISMASHQLRTPLTNVKGYLSMVLEGDAGALTEMQQKLLDQAFISSQRMVYLIADLLNVSRLRTGKFVIDAAPSNLAEVIESEVGQLKATATSRKLSLSYNKPENFPTLMLDETKIRQVIMNFMDNAIYYTPAGGHITVELKETDQTVEYTVTDDGMGVPRSEQHHLFTKFYRAGNAKKARPDGTGLGLFMSKKVIVAQGGNLIFHSQENKGSTFGFSFEKAKLLPNPAITNTQ